MPSASSTGTRPDAFAYLFVPVDPSRASLSRIVISPRHELAMDVYLSFLDFCSEVPPEGHIAIREYELTLDGFLKCASPEIEMLRSAF